MPHSIAGDRSAEAVRHLLRKHGDCLFRSNHERRVAVCLLVKEKIGDLLNPIQKVEDYYIPLKKEIKAYVTYK